MATKRQWQDKHNNWEAQKAAYKAFLATETKVITSKTEIPEIAFNSDMDVVCPNCHESWSKDTPGHREAMNMLYVDMKPYCPACQILHDVATCTDFIEDHKDMPACAEGCPMAAKCEGDTCYLEEEGLC